MPRRRPRLPLRPVIAPPNALVSRKVESSPDPKHVGIRFEDVLARIDVTQAPKVRGPYKKAAAAISN